jgi:hypothetical protein
MKEIEVKIETFKNKDVDFLDVQKHIINLFETEQITVEGKTVEDISDLLYMNLSRRWDGRDISIQITDESKCGCSMLYPKDPKIVLNPNQRNIVVKCQI